MRQHRLNLRCHGFFRRPGWLVPVLRSALCVGVQCGSVATAQDVAGGARLYLRLDSDLPGCVFCHGPDPGQNHNNILRAAGSPDTLVKVMNTTGSMGYLRAELSEVQVRDISAYLGSVAQALSEQSPLVLWPLTLDFGRLPTGESSERQWVQLRNPSATRSVRLDAIRSTGVAFTLSHACPPELAPGGGCDVAVILNTSQVGLHRAALQVSAGGLDAVVGAVGYGSAVPVSRLAWSTPAGASSLALSATAGSVARASLTLTNPGPMPAVLGLTSLAGPQANLFRVESGCAEGSVLPAGTACTLTVSYAANALPDARAVLQLRSDQSNPQAVRVSGTSVPSAPSPPAGPIPPAVPAEPGAGQGVDAGTGGAGCGFTTDPAKSRDATLFLLLVAAALASARRKPRA